MHPSDRHGQLIRELLAPFGTAGNLVTDAHVAALFARFRVCRGSTRSIAAAPAAADGAR
jgi:hypothetical protein